MGNLRLPFVFGIHDHQPLGNFDSVIERLTRRCYLQFFQAVEKTPWIRINCHVSGLLLEWWERRFPECIEILGRLASRKQVEFLAGGYYEPVLAAIPSEERLEQIGLLKEKIEGLFGQVPKGLWLTERVWEPEIIKDLVASGIEYCLVDDRHFIVSGFKKEELYGYYLTESGGKTLKLFPIDEKLRYHIPFSLVERLESYLFSIREKGGMAIYVDDGEKFGAWPGTEKWVYTDGWLDTFFKKVEEWQKEFLEMVFLQDVVDRIPPKGLAYLPNASYEEMEEWTLPPRGQLEFKELLKGLGEEKGERFRPYLRGGNWKNFFIRYPESNRLHKRNLELSASSRGARDESRRLILASQCNDAYWHGVFGGLYLPHLRSALWDALLEGEHRLRGHEPLTVEARDVDMDGRLEVICRSGAFSLILDSIGGQLVEYSVYKPPHNYLNTLTRRFEGYHEELKRTILEGVSAHAYNETRGEEDVSSIHDLKKIPPKELLDDLIYDWYEKNAFIDHLFDPSATVRDFKRCDFREWGDFANQPFEWEIKDYSVVFKRQGGVYGPEGKKKGLLVEKRYFFSDDGTLEVTYRLENLSRETIACAFGVEWNLYPVFLKQGKGGLWAGGKEVSYSSLFYERGDEFLLREPGTLALKIGLKGQWHLWGFPIETVSQSEKGYEKTIQGLSLMAWRPMDIAPGGSFVTRVGFFRQPL